MTRNNERGQALAITALAVTLLMGFAGLAVDMGALRYQKRLQQTAADAAAIAGAANMAGSETSAGIIAGAQSASATNGFTDNTGGVTCTNNPAALGCITVTVNVPPLSGPHAGNTGCSPAPSCYVEVLVTAVQPTFFMKAMGVGSRTVTARAVATNTSGGGPSNGCAWTLGQPAKSIGVDVQGSVILNAPTCGIADNGNFDRTGGALTVKAGTFSVSGTDTGHGTGTVTCGPDQTAANCPTYNAPVAANPLASLPTPCSLGYTCTGGSAATAVNNTFSPGTYSSISVGPGNTTFNPGIYIIDGSSGGLNIGANAVVTGTGVMFYFTNGSTVSTNGTATVNLTAPSATNCPSCPTQYDGILFYQDPADTNTGVNPSTGTGKCPPGSLGGPSLGGNSGSAYNGVVYFPADQLWLFGNSGTIDLAMTVTDSLCMSGNATFNMQGASGLPPGVTILTHPVLVE